MKKILATLILVLSCIKTSATDLKTIILEEFIAKNPSIARKSIIDLILKQFNDKMITQSDLDKLWNDEEAKEELYLARFQIVNQKLYAAGADETHPYFRAFITYLQKMVTLYKIEDVDFMVHMVDQLKREDQSDKNVKKLGEIPTFMFFKNMDDKYEQNRLLIPEAFILWNSWRKTLSLVKDASNRTSWQDKENKFFWRGTNTGTATLPYNLENMSKLPRLVLVFLSKLYPDLIDAKFTSIMPNSYDHDKNHDLKKIINLLFGDESDKTPEADHIPYKYLLSIDGNSCSGTRVPWIMYSNSVLVKQETNKIEWFYPALKAYVNYVPINQRLTNIFSQLDWMRNHDQEVKQIAINAHNFIAEELMPEQIEAHMVIVLNEYHKIQKDKKIIPTLPSAEDTRSIWGQTKAVLKRVKRNISSFLK